MTDNQTEGLEGSVGIMSDMDATKAALREMDWTEDDGRRCLSILARATETGKQWMQRATTAEEQARHYQERARQLEQFGLMLLDCLARHDVPTGELAQLRDKMLAITAKGEKDGN